MSDRVCCCRCSGRSVLNQKSELQRELERRRDTQQRRQQQLAADANKNSFERALDERLQRIEPDIKVCADASSRLHRICDSRVGIAGMRHRLGQLGTHDWGGGGN